MTAFHVKINYTAEGIVDLVDREVLDVLGYTHPKLTTENVEEWLRSCVPFEDITSVDENDFPLPYSVLSTVVVGAEEVSLPPEWPTYVHDKGEE